MVQRVVVDAVVRHDSAAPGERREAMETTTARKVKPRRRRPGAMAAIKARMLRCSRAKADLGRFKRRYYLAADDCGGAVDYSAVFFYLACLVCTAPPSVSVVGVREELK